MSDIKCPYCFYPMDIPMDNPILEEVKYKRKCDECKKEFTFYAFQTVHFVTEKQDEQENEE